MGTSTAGNLSQDGGPGVIRVLIADDHEVFRRGILNTIEQIDGMTVVGEAADGEEAIEKIQALTPDVLLLDISMPKLDGLGTLREISELGLQTRVILLSVYATDEYIFDGLRAGARGTGCALNARESPSRLPSAQKLNAEDARSGIFSLKEAALP